MINEEFLKILACPLCKADVVMKDEKIVCTKCSRKYPIKDGIPIMLIEEAQLDEKKER
ncbi:MAG: Trm112 family protein [Candidatus Omnitrophica bacterium]|nr:Trm112 family protein [Candidatus Omnitrophota bacterium]